MGTLARLVLGIPARRQRPVPLPPGELRDRLEAIQRTFVDAYHHGLEEQRLDLLAARLAESSLELRGFGYEGAAMAMAVLDGLRPGRDLLRRFLAGPAAPHVYISHVGAGWALTLPLFPRRRLLARLDPVLRWLAFDGLGFHHGFLKRPATVERQAVPAWVRGFARRSFDVGVGRSLWFALGTDVERIRRRVDGFPPARRPDLWSGLGAAAGYAGGPGEAALLALRRAAGDSAPALAQGVGFAAQTRARAGNPTAYTALACEVVCGRSAAEVAAVVDAATAGLPPDGIDAAGREEPAFEVWRRRLRERLGGARDAVEAPSAAVR